MLVLLKSAAPFGFEITPETRQLLGKRSVCITDAKLGCVAANQKLRVAHKRVVATDEPALIPRQKLVNASVSKGEQEELANKQNASPDAQLCVAHGLDFVVVERPHKPHHEQRRNSPRRHIKRVAKEVDPRAARNECYDHCSEKGSVNTV